MVYCTAFMHVCPPNNVIVTTISCLCGDKKEASWYMYSYIQVGVKMSMQPGVRQLGPKHGFFGPAQTWYSTIAQGRAGPCLCCTQTRGLAWHGPQFSGRPGGGPVPDMAC
jgi:hypothetical protein